MKKKFIKIIACISSIFMMGSMSACNFGGCGTVGNLGSTSNSTGSSDFSSTDSSDFSSDSSAGDSLSNMPTVKDPVMDYTEHKVEGTLHKGLDEIKDTGIPFVVNGKTEYKLVFDENNAYSEKAARFIGSHINAATGASVAIETNPTWSASAKYIVVGNKAMIEASNFKKTTEQITMAGYQIQTVDNSVFIVAGGSDGYNLGALAFLRIVIGYDCLAADTFIYTKDGSYLPEMDVVENADFTFRHDMTYYQHSLDKAYPMGWGVNGSLLMSTGSNQYHNSFWYLDPMKYEFSHENCGLGYSDEECAQGHKNWYSEVRCGIKPGLGMSGGEYYQVYASQLCYTAHGSEKDLQVMQQVVADTIVQEALFNPKNANKNVITVTAQDESTNCLCEYCQAKIDKYGNIGGAIIPFVNGVDDIVQQKLQEYADETGTEKKLVNILMFAYQNTRFAPEVLDETTKCNANVGVLVAASKVRYAHTFYDDVNAADAEAIQEWSKFGDLYYWFYNLNNMNYFIPSNVFSSIVENFRFAKANSGTWMGDNGVWMGPYATGFTLFKEYLDSHLGFNVNYNYIDLKRQFFDNFYGDGGVYMEQFFDEVVAYMSYQRDYCSNTDFDGVCVNCNPDDPKYWPLQMVKRWQGLCDQAMKAIETSKLNGDGSYERYRNHITLESLFPRYVMCKFYEDKFSGTDIAAMRQSFYLDCKSFNMAQESDYESLDPLWKAWGVA